MASFKPNKKGEWFLYYLKCPEFGHVRYIGITTNTKRRLNEHLSRKRSNHKSNWILSLKSKNLVPIMEIAAANLTKKEARKLEFLMGFLFFLFGNKNLTNHLAALGNIPPSNKGKPRSKETRKKISQSKRRYYQNPKHREALRGAGNPFYGQTHTITSKEKIAKSRRGRFRGKNNPFYGKTHSAVTKKRLSQKAKKRFAGIQGHELAKRAQKATMKPIKVWNDKQVFTFESLSEACRQLSLDSGALWRVLNRKQKTHKSYKAKYL